VIDVYMEQHNNAMRLDFGHKLVNLGQHLFCNLFALEFTVFTLKRHM